MYDYAGRHPGREDLLSQLLMYHPDGPMLLRRYPVVMNDSQEIE